MSRSRQEQEVLGFILGGLSAKKIAMVLGIAHKTVNYHRARILEKFGVDSAAGLLREVALAGLSDLCVESVHVASESLGMPRGLPAGFDTPGLDG